MKTSYFVPLIVLVCIMLGAPASRAFAGDIALVVAPPKCVVTKQDGSAVFKYQIKNTTNKRIRLADVLSNTYNNATGYDVGPEYIEPGETVEIIVYVNLKDKTKPGEVSINCQGSFKARVLIFHPDGLKVSDNFDSYLAGSSIAGQGGWEIWYTGGNDGEVSADFANSAPNSLKAFAFTDVVQRYEINSGLWVFGIMTYCPSNAFGADGYVIMMNQYETNDNWSLQVRFGGGVDGDKLVESQFDGATLPLIEDRWVGFIAVIDLDTNRFDEYYDGEILATNLSWTENVSGGGLPQIRALDLYSNGIDPMYIDDVSLQPVISSPEIVPLDLVAIVKGTYNSGDLASLAADDDNYYVVAAQYDPTDPLAVINSTIRGDGHSAAAGYTSGKLLMIEKCNTTQAKYRIRAVKAAGGFATLVDGVATSFSESVFDSALPPPISDFIDAALGNRLRVEWRAATGNRVAGFFRHSTDQVQWTLTP